MHSVMYYCPSTTFGNCQWEGRQEEILPHFENCHQDFFLTKNSFHLDVTTEDQVNYLMHLGGETYLIQVKYLFEDDEAEIKLRFLGTAKKAMAMSYFVDIQSGNFAFSSKNNNYGYSVITKRDGAIIIDVSSIRAICGRRAFENITAYINVEGTSNTYVYRSATRSYSDSKVLERRVKEIFQRNSSCRSSIRKRSADSIEMLEVIRRKSLIFEDEKPSVFVAEILHDLVNSAVEKFEENHRKEINDNQEEINELKEFRTSPKNFGLFPNSFFDDELEFSLHNSFLRKMNSLQDLHVEACNTIQFEENLCTRETNLELEAIRENEAENILKGIELDKDETNTAEDVDGVIEREELASEVPKEDQESEALDSVPEVILRPKRNESMHDNNSKRLSTAEYEYFEKLESIRCNLCRIIMIPPIFLCLNGHNVCLTCKSLTCSCGSEVSDMRNFHLEEISRSTTHPCRFLTRGCTEVLSCYDIHFHEIKCDYFIYKCPQCLHTGKHQELIKHVKLLHPSLKIVDTLENPFPKNSEFLVANKFGIFYCTAFVIDNSIEWSVIFCSGEQISFSCLVTLKSKKNSKVYVLRKTGNFCKSIIYLNWLKGIRLKEKNAVLSIKTNS